MIISYWFICAFAPLINICTALTVYPQNTVEGVIGGSVVLPCSSRENEFKIQDIIVLWKHNDKLNVCDIIKSNSSVEHQDSKYKNRTETFPKEFEKGKFSLKLNNLTLTDAGKYQCYILHSSELVPVHLQINVSATRNEKQPAAEDGNQPAETKLILMKILIPVLCVSMLFCISVCIVYRKWKGGDKTSSSRCQSRRGCHQGLSKASSDKSETCNQEHTGLQTKA